MSAPSPDAQAPDAPPPVVPPSVPPKESAATLELRARPRAVTRLNRKTFIAFVGGFVFAVLFAMMWGLRPHEPKTEEGSKQAPKAERVTKAEGLARLPRDYGSFSKPKGGSDSAPSNAPQLGPPIGEFGQPIGGSHVAHARQPTGAARVHRSSSTDESGGTEVFFKLVKRSREGRSVEAPSRATSLLSSMDASSGSSSEQPVSDLLAGLSACSGLCSSAGPSGAPLSAHRSISGHNPDSFIYASGTVETPRSPRQLMAGTLIRAALVTGINSDLPGQMIATVVENVFDTLTGKYLLIPQGSRLLGEYESNTKYGQERVQVSWSRLIRPDGSSIVLDQLLGVDAEGYSGLQDHVDEHAKRLVEGAALSTLIGVAAELAAPQRSGAGGNIIIAARDSVHDTVNEMGQRITERNLNVKPTLTIRPGYPVQVIVNKDLIL